MAKVIITFEDNDGLEINAEFEPETGYPSADTPAQAIAREVLIQLYKAAPWDEAEVNNGPTI